MADLKSYDGSDLFGDFAQTQREKLSNFFTYTQFALGVGWASILLRGLIRSKMPASMS